MKNPVRRFDLTFALLIFSLVTAIAPLRADDKTLETAQIGRLHYLSAGQPNVVALLAPPPLPNSAEQVADMASVREALHAATADVIASARLEKKFDIFNFTPAIGSFFQPGKLSKTEAFFQKVQTDAALVTDNAKEFYKRPRPYVLDPSLVSGKLQKSFSYPSGHSTESMVLALVLADLVPERHEAIVAVARDIGWHRVQAARHYPTDIYAGRVLAQAIVIDMKKNTAFQRDLATVRLEIASAAQK